MDLQKIGRFLAQLRREQGLTQEQLGETLGVSGKTVSRWETGTYLPPVEMLLRLSERYQVSMNELVTGERARPEEQAEKAEEAVTQVLRDAPFLLHERQRYWTRKWQREHTAMFVGQGVLVLAIAVLGAAAGESWLPVAAPWVALALMIYDRNRMMAYVERHAFGEPVER